VLGASLLVALQVPMVAADTNSNARLGQAGFEPVFYLPWRAGVSHVVTQGAGGSPSHGCPGNSCYALDFGLSHGEPVLASASGSIIYAGYRTDFGNNVLIQHAADDCTRYAHLSSISRSSGAIGRGEQVGLTGETGYAIGAHLHFVRENCNFASRPVGFNETGGATPAEGRWVVSQNSVGPTGDPFGSYDLASSPQPGLVRVGGWAIDPNALTSPVTIHVYVGGQAGLAGSEGHNIGPADLYRPDVGNAYPGAGNNHGFDLTFGTVKTGSQPVCAYAINIGSGSNQSLGCKNVTITNPNPFGSYDLASSPQPGLVRVGGWAIDPSALTHPVTIHVYVGGQAGVPGSEGHNIGPANLYRPDVGRAYPGTGNNHGFDLTFGTAKTGNQPVCAYAINIGIGANQLLSCKNVSVAMPDQTWTPPPDPNPPPDPAQDANPTPNLDPDAMPPSSQATSGGPAGAAPEIDTTIARGPRGQTQRRSPTFHLQSSNSPATFECKMDQKKWSDCSPRIRYKKLAYGRHVFLARATSPDGLVDSSPAKSTFRILRHR